jgi:probable 2-oxoglutarate dehydrogenase E1 component DHKTD1
MAGKIYYDLLKERQARSLEKEVAFIRLEELAPFPFVELREALKDYDTVEEVMWLQEEPKNQGAFTHVSSRIDLLLSELASRSSGKPDQVVYRGRKESALPAPGIGKMYGAQQKALIESAFEGLSL